MKFDNANQFYRKSGVRWGERGAPVQGLGVVCTLVLGGASY